MLRQLGYSIIQLILLIRNYGVSTGFSIWFQIAFSFSSSINIRSSIFKNPVSLRKKDSDLDIFNQVFAERQYKWPGIDQFQPRVIVDAGANIGLAAIYFSNTFPSASIYCIEPVAANFSQLKKNTTSYIKVQLLQAAVWYRHEILQISNPEGFSAGLTLTESGASTGIQGYTISEIMQYFDLSHIDILKIDVEGAEKEIFGLGDTDWLQHVDVIIIELHDMYKEGTTKAFFNALHNKFEKIYFHGENLICYLK